MTIEWQSSFYEPAPNSADHVIINNQIVNDLVAFGSDEIQKPLL